MLPGPFAILGDASNPGIHATWGSCPEYIESLHRLLTRSPWPCVQTKAAPRSSLHGFLFDLHRYSEEVVKHLELDAEEHVADFSLVCTGPSERTIGSLRRLYFDEGENAVRARLGLPELPLQLFTDGTETYVACSVGDALAAQRKHLGENPNPRPERWRRIAPDTPWKVWLEWIGQGTPITKTAAEWAESTPRGFLCSTEQ
jgi:hypothetical protein